MNQQYVFFDVFVDQLRVRILVKVNDRRSIDDFSGDDADMVH